MRNPRVSLVVVSLTTLALIATGAVATQGKGIEIKETAKLSGGALGGAMGWMARMGGMPDEVETKTFVNAAATKKRVDEDDQSTIIDLENSFFLACHE